MNSPINTIRLILFVTEAVQKKLDQPSGADADWEEINNNPQTKNLYALLSRREQMNYDLIHQASISYNVPYMLFMLPAEYDWHPLPADKMSEKYKFQAAYKDKFYNLMLRKKDYPVVDLSGVFDGMDAEKGPYTDGDPVHYNDAGSELIAKALFDAINPLIRKKLEKQ